MRTRVVKHSADSEKDAYEVTLKGEGDLGFSCLVKVEVKLKTKEEDLLEKFPLHVIKQIILEAGK